MAALAALQRDLLAGSTAKAAPRAEGPAALAALRRDIAAQPPVTGDKPNIFAAALPAAAVPEEGPHRADGRKSGAYSAAELASIYQAYQRAAAAEKASTPRVED